MIIAVNGPAGTDTIVVATVVTHSASIDTTTTPDWTAVPRNTPPPTFISHDFLRTNEPQVEVL